MAKTLLFLIVSSIAIFVPRLSGAAANTPALFILGDSTVDVGTNNYIEGTSTKADSPHYGIDLLALRPTGRLSNGLNTADFTAKHLGFIRSPQPYLYLVSRKHELRMFRGVNFTSAGSGLLDTTGTTVVPLSEQIKQFSRVQRNLTVRLGAEVEHTNKLLSKSMFAISAGSNDLFAYFGSNATVPPQQCLWTSISVAVLEYLVNNYLSII